MQGAALVKGFRFGGGHITAVESIIADEEDMQSDAPIYDLSGRRVENPAPVFYLQGHKKIVKR